MPGKITSLPWSPFIYVYTIYHGWHSLLSSNLFIPTFAEISVNMTIVASFINGSVSSFESCYLIKYCFLYFMSSHKKKISIGIFMCLCSPFFGLIFSLLKTSLSLSFGYISITSFMSCMNIAPSGKYQPLPLCLSMWLICHQLRFLTLVLILLILIVYLYQDHF